MPFLLPYISYLFVYSRFIESYSLYVGVAAALLLLTVIVIVTVSVMCRRSREHAPDTKQNLDHERYITLYTGIYTVLYISWLSSYVQPSRHGKNQI